MKKTVKYTVGYYEAKIGRKLNSMERYWVGRFRNLKAGQRKSFARFCISDVGQRFFADCIKGGSKCV